MRILVDIRHLGNPEPSGVGEYTSRLLRALLEIDRRSGYVFFSSGSNRAEHFARSAVRDIANGNKKVQHVHVRAPNKLLNLQVLAGKGRTIDALALGAYHLLFLPNLNIVNIPDNLPTVLTVHDLSWKLFPEFFSRKMHAWHAATKPEPLIARASHVITPSQSTKRDLELLFQKPPERIHTIPHGVGGEFTAKRAPQDHGVRSKYKLPKRFALFLGTLEPRKNIETIIAGVEEYRRISGDDLHLVLAGKWGWQSGSLRLRISPLLQGGTKGGSAQAWIHHLGYVAEQDRPMLYRHARVFIWPSIYEGFGLPVLEAMASGTPVITSATSSLPELTKEAAIHVDPYNHLDITVALEQLFASNDLSDVLAQKGVQRASDFTWKQTAEATLKVFEQAAKF